MGNSWTWAYLRGAGYLDRVQGLSVGDDRVQATVRGTMPYTVVLTVEDEQPRWSCTCPAAEDGAFCKHCVTVGLALDPDRDEGALLDQGTAGGHEDQRPPELDEYVAGLDRERLIQLVLAQTEEDWRLRERLLAEARAAQGEGPNLAAWRRRVESVLQPYGDFVPYAEAAGWAHEVNEVIDALEELFAAGHPDAVMVLTEHAYRRADEATQYVDDSDGWFGDISERLADLHLRACADGAVDPRGLARRLVDLELTSELDGFHRAAAIYAAVLGEAGLEEYRTLLTPRWQDLLKRSEGHSIGRFRVREALIGVALASGDPDELIEVKSHDLHSPYDYLEIARTLMTADRTEEAAQWARRGLETYADRSQQTPPLREFLAGLLREQGEESAALNLFWDAFERAPSLETYRRLQEEAGDQGDAYGARAIRLLREQTSAGVRTGAGTGVLVQILLYEGQADEAWEVAAEHGCDDRLWLTLARARETSHPLDAIEVYQRAMFTEIDRKKNDAYRRAVDFLGRIKQLSLAGEQPDRFPDLLDRVRW